MEIFSAGNTGFITAYKYHPWFYNGSDTSGLWPETRYAVGNNANNYHPNFYGQSHTNPGTGNFMIINGATLPPPVVVWSQTITIEPYTTYYFSAWAMSLNNVSPYAQLQFSVNGEQVGTIDNLTAGPSSTAGPWNWTRFYGNWTSGAWHYSDPVS